MCDLAVTVACKEDSTAHSISKHFLCLQTQLLRSSGEGI